MSMKWRKNGNENFEKNFFDILCSGDTDRYLCHEGLAAPEVVPEIEIDEENLYTGMDKTYKDGYQPRVENDTAHMVVPLVYADSLKNNILKVSLNLGNGKDIPFVSDTYEKEFSLTREKINGSEQTADCYLAVFDLKLKGDRKTVSIR